MKKIKEMNVLGITLSITLIFLVVLVVFTTVSYAYWSRTQEQTENNKVISGCLNYSFNDKNADSNPTSINLTNTYPISETEAMQKTPYTFTITNECTTDMFYNVTLNTTGTEDLDNYLTYKLVDNENNIIGSSIIGTLPTYSDYNNTTYTEDGSNYSILKSYILTTGLLTHATMNEGHTQVLTAGESITYKLYVWMNEDVSDPSTMNKRFEAKVIINGSSSKSLPINCDGSFSDCLITLSSIDPSISKDIHANTEQTQDKATIDYRYIGANPDNYVCLESSGKCTDNQLYRIIGVIPTQKELNGDFANRIKLIKATNYVGPTAKSSKTAQGGYGYYWSGSSTNQSNDWTVSTLNTEILNGTDTEDSYLDSISNYQKYIDDTVWYLGAQANSDYKSQNLYINERGTNRGSASGTTYNTTAKIGLMYSSDYGYATSGGSEEKRGTCLSSIMNNGNWGPTSDGLCKRNDWLFQEGYYQWTLMSIASYSDRSWSVGSSGSAHHDFSVFNYVYGVRPVFNLASNVKYAGGTGTYNNPYTISI